MIRQMTMAAIATVGLGNGVVSSSPINWAKLHYKVEHISHANWQRFLDLLAPPPPPPPLPNAPLYMVLYSVLNDRTRRHAVRSSGGGTPTCSARGFSETRVRACWRLSRSEHLYQHTSLYKCMILIFKRYSVNKHNLLTKLFL